MWDAPSKHLQSEHAPSALYLKVRRPLRHAAATGRTWQNIVGWQLMHEAGASKLWKANTCLQALACTHLIFIHFPHFKTIQNRFKTKSLGVPSSKYVPGHPWEGSRNVSGGPNRLEHVGRTCHLVGSYVLCEHSLVFSWGKVRQLQWAVKTAHGGSISCSYWRSAQEKPKLGESFSLLIADIVTATWVCFPTVAKCIPTHQNSKRTSRLQKPWSIPKYS